MSLTEQRSDTVNTRGDGSIHGFFYSFQLEFRTSGDRGWKAIFGEAKRVYMSPRNEPCEGEILALNVEGRGTTNATVRPDLNTE